MKQWYASGSLAHFPMLIKTIGYYGACACYYVRTITSLVTIHLPTRSPLSAFKRPYNFARNPASIKVALLSLYFLIIDITRIHFARVESDVVSEALISLAGVGIVPRSIGDTFAIHVDGVVRCLTFEFTEGSS